MGQHSAHNIKAAMRKSLEFSTDNDTKCALFWNEMGEALERNDDTEYSLSE